MELTVLGKYGPYPKAGGGAASGYLVKNGGDSLLLDMGSGTLSRLLSSVDLKNLGGILFYVFSIKFICYTCVFTNFNICAHCGKL